MMVFRSSNYCKGTTVRRPSLAEQYELLAYLTPSFGSGGTVAVSVTFGCDDGSRPTTAAPTSPSDADATADVVDAVGMLVPYEDDRVRVDDAVVPSTVRYGDTALVREPMAGKSAPARGLVDWVLLYTYVFNDLDDKNCAYSFWITVV